jgi:hypothetical protein
MFLSLHPVDELKIGEDAEVAVGIVLGVRSHDDAGDTAQARLVGRDELLPQLLASRRDIVAVDLCRDLASPLKEKAFGRRT